LRYFVVPEELITRCRLQLPRRLARLLPDRADVLLPQQIGQQGLYLAVAVRAALPWDGRKLPDSSDRPSR
jgi:hypothetical protein